MTKIEKHFRLIQIGERIRQLQGELIVIMTEGSSAGMYPLHQSEIHLGRAAKELESTSTLDLETLLQLSIVTVREQRRCEQIGSETVNAEGPTFSENVRPFPKP